VVACVALAKGAALEAGGRGEGHIAEEVLARLVAVWDGALVGRAVDKGEHLGLAAASCLAEVVLAVGRAVAHSVPAARC
jgi:hypothetical protein